MSIVQARFFFQQLISGVSYCHSMVGLLHCSSVHFLLLCAWLKLLCFMIRGVVKQVCHRDLKLENTLLDGSTAPRLKICDVGYSKVQLLKLTLFCYTIQCLLVPCLMITVMACVWIMHNTMLLLTRLL